jgi:hypothetical protein
MPIKKTVSLLFLASALTCAAQTPAILISTPVQKPVIGSYQTITAIVTGVNDKTVIWSTSDPTHAPLVGNTTCPLGSVNCTIGVYSTTTGTYTITATSHANGTVSASSTITFGARPTPTAGHPRFFLTSSTLAAQRAKGVSSNPLYVPISNFATNEYNSGHATYGFTYSTWSGSACTGGTAPSLASLNGAYIADLAYWMSLGSMLDNSSANRNLWGCAGRDIFMSVMQMFFNNEIPYAWNYPYGLENSANGLIFTADALMAGGYFSAADLQTVRTYFYGLAFAAGQAPNGAGIPMIPTGLNNPTTQFTPTNQYAITHQRATGNNYTLTWFEMMSAAALTFDDNGTDDPVIPQGQCLSTFVGNGGTGYVTGDTVKLAGGNCVATVHATGGVVDGLTITTPAGGYSGSTNPPSLDQWPAASSTTTVTGTGTGLTANLFVGNTCGATRGNICSDGTAANLHAYWSEAVGSALYRWWASWEDPAVVQQAYNAAYSNMATIPQCNVPWTANAGGTLPCLGVDRGGEPYEGHSYGNSFGYFRDALTFIDTAGYNDPVAYGPQVGSSDTSSIWDLRYIGDLNLQLGMSGVVNDARWAYVTDGDSNTAIGFADDPAQYTTESSLLLADYNAGLTYRSPGVQWLMTNAAFGRADGTATGPGGHACATSCGYMAEIGNDYASPTVVAAFLALPAGNPVTSPPPDPRPSMPLDWYNEGNRHVESRTGWTIGANTIFSAFCPDTQSDHEHQVCGDFDIYSNGEYITKGRTEFDNYDYGITAMFEENGQALLQPPNQSLCAPYPTFCTYWTAATGGQLWEGNQRGPNFFQFSQMPNYVATTVDMTLGYNGAWGGFNGINGATAATRQVLWLRGSNIVFTYDYGATGSNSWPKVDAINTTGAPTISGNTATWLTHSGTQKAAWTNLLPASGTTFAKNSLANSFTLTAPYTNLQVNTTMQATCTANNVDGSTTDVSSNPSVLWYANGAATISSTGLITAGSSPGPSTVQCFFGSASNPTVTVNVISGASSTPTLSNTATNGQSPDWELMNSVAVMKTTPSWQNLNVLQWGASSFTPITATVVQSTAGQGFDGALVGSTLTMFMRAWNSSAIFTGVTYPASGATTHYVQGLAPNTTYSVAGAGTPATCKADSAGVCTFPATGTGNVTVGTITVTPTSNFTGVSLIGLSPY